MPTQQFNFLIQSVLSGVHQNGRGSQQRWVFVQESEQNTSDFYDEEDLKAAAQYFKFIGLETNFAAGTLTVTCPEEFNFENIERHIGILKQANFHVTIARDFSIEVSYPIRQPIVQLRNALVKLVSPVSAEADEDGANSYSLVGYSDDRQPLLAPQAPIPSPWEVLCAEVTSENPCWPEIFDKLLSEDPLEYFQCIINMGRFDAGQTVVMLPDGDMYEKETLSRCIDASEEKYAFKSPKTNLGLPKKITPYVYEDLMKYIENPSDANLSKLCQDYHTGQVMENPRIITCYNPSVVSRGGVLVRICDESTVGTGGLTPQLKESLFGLSRSISRPGTRAIPDEHIRNVAFDDLKYFIDHPEILPRLLPPEQARSRLVDELKRRHADFQREEREKQLGELTHIKRCYFSNRHSMFPPIRFLSIKSHAAEVEDASTLPEITRLLQASYREGGDNASTKTIDFLKLPKPARR